MVSDHDGGRLYEVGEMTEFMIRKYVEPILDRATISILKDFEYMEGVADGSPDKVFWAMERMTSIKGWNTTTPVQGGGNRREEMLAENIDIKIMAEMGAREAKQYFETFYPAWNSLTDDERYLLRERFILGGNGIQRIMDRKNVEKTKAYEMSNQALTKLRRALFW